MKHRNYYSGIALVLALVVLTMSCGPNNGGGENNSPGPVCESIPQPSEMDDCVAEDFNETLYTRSDLKDICENRCRTIQGFYTGSSTPLGSLELLNGITTIRAGMRLDGTVSLSSLQGAGNIEVIGTAEHADDLALFIGTTT